MGLCSVCFWHGCNHFWDKIVSVNRGFKMKKNPPGEITRRAARMIETYLKMKDSRYTQNHTQTPDVLNHLLQVCFIKEFPRLTGKCVRRSNS